MSDNQQRTELQIDIFELKAQPARALASLTPPELVAAILDEFRRDLLYLSERPGDYQLLRAADQTTLDDERPIGRQCAPRTHLLLAERAQTAPQGAQSLDGHGYLREVATGRVFPLHWQPALIGRPDTKLADNALLAVDLSAHPSRMRVSRRQARIVAEGRHYYLEALAPNNPVAVESATGDQQTLGAARHPLHPGDTVVLIRSGIRLAFLERTAP